MFKRTILTIVSIALSITFFAQGARENKMRLNYLTSWDGTDTCSFSADDIWIANKNGQSSLHIKPAFLSLNCQTATITERTADINIQHIASVKLNAPSTTRLSPIAPTDSSGEIATTQYIQQFKAIRLLTEAERCGDVAITDGNTAVFKVLYSLKLPDTVYAGSEMSITALCEITNPQSYNVQISSFIKIGNSYTDSAFLGNGNGQPYVVAPHGENCTPAEHHMVVPVPIDYFPRQNIIRGYLNMVVYFVSSSVVPPQYVHIEPDYGHFTCTIRRNNTTFKPYSQEVTDWLTFAPANDQPTPAEILAIDNFVDSCKAHNNWVFDRFFIHGTHSRTLSRVSLQAMGWNQAIEVGGVTWTPGNGYTTSSTGTKYLNLNYFVPFNSTIWGTQDGFMFGFYRSTNNAEANADMGCSTSGGVPICFLYADFNGNSKELACINSNNVTTSSTATVATGRGLTYAKRTASAATSVWRNGVNIGTNTTASTGTPNVPFFLGSINGNGTPSTPTNQTYQISFIGNPNINDTKFNVDIQQLVTAMGW